MRKFIVTSRRALDDFSAAKSRAFIWFIFKLPDCGSLLRSLLSAGPGKPGTNIGA